MTSAAQLAVTDGHEASEHRPVLQAAVVQVHSGGMIAQPTYYQLAVSYGTVRLIIVMSAAQSAAIEALEAPNKPMSVLLDAVVQDLIGRRISQQTYGMVRLIIVMSAAQLAAIDPLEALNKPIIVL